MKRDVQKLRTENESGFDISGFVFCPATGVITFNGKRRDKAAPGGYRRVARNGRRVMAHRLAWRLTHGFWPVELIDHVNHDRSDNRLCNLRAASAFQNQQNSKASCLCRSKERGVYIDRFDNRKPGRWAFSLQAFGKRFKGYASHSISAIVAARLVRRTIHGQFSFQN